MGEFATLGGYFAILSGVALVGVVTSAALMPKELKAQSEAHEFWSVLCQNPRAHLALHWTTAGYALLAIAVIPALYEIVAADGRAWAWFGSALGFIGLAVTARSHLLEVA